MKIILSPPRTAAGGVWPNIERDTSTMPVPRQGDVVYLRPPDSASRAPLAVKEVCWYLDGRGPEDDEPCVYISLVTWESWRRHTSEVR